MQKVNCHNFEAMIHETLDQRDSLENNPALKEHARECLPCLSTLRDYVSVEKTLSHLVGQANQAAPITQQSLRHGRFGTLGLLASLAAGLLICINIANRSGESPQFPNLVQNAEPDPESPFVNDGNLSSARRAQEPNTLADNSATAASTPQMSLDGFAASTKPATNPLFTFHTKTPQIRMVSWERITEKLDPLTPYYQYSAEIPGVRPLHSGLNATVELIQKSLSP